MPSLKTISTFSTSDVFGRVAIHHDKVSGFACGNRAKMLVLAEPHCAVLGGDVDRFFRSEAGLDEQFEVPLIAEAGQNPAVAGGIAAGHEQAALLDEVALKLQLLLEERSPKGWFGRACDTGAYGDVVSPSLREE